MTEYVTREELEMLTAKLDERYTQTQTKLGELGAKQDKTLANMADHKAMHAAETVQQKSMAEDIQSIKSDKIWLNRLVIGFCIITTLGFIFKMMFGS